MNTLLGEKTAIGESLNLTPKDIDVKQFEHTLSETDFTKITVF